MANAPLYEESDKWEYMAKPNQDGCVLAITITTTAISNEAKNQIQQRK